MIMLDGLGKKLKPIEVAELFGIAESTVKRYPQRYGGVRMYGRTLFFENLIEQEIRRQYAIQTYPERENDLDWTGTVERHSEKENLLHKARSRKMGIEAQEAAKESQTEYDPYGLCA